MVCYHPLAAWQSVKVNSAGKHSITFNAPPRAKGWTQVNLPCGQCIGCRLEYSRQWAVRCMHEAHMHTHNIFITLTYDDDHVPWSRVTGEQTLVKKHFQDFMKRFRKKFCNERIRFYHCGEYGSESNRPHYHAIIFGFDFPDKQIYKVSPNGDKYYVSDTLNNLWSHGYCIIADVNFDTCAYVARYILKKVNGEMAESKYEGIQKEYVTMSRKPGIASEWFAKYKGDVYPYDEVIIRSNGKVRKLRPPRYYDMLYDLENPEDFERIKSLRIERAKGKEEEIDNGRLAAKEKVKQLKIQKLKRSL